MKFKSLLTRMVLTLFILMAASPSYSAMYKYQDEKGEWVYSQHPPADGDFTTIKAQKQSRSSRIGNDARKAKIDKARESVIGKQDDKQGQSRVEQETAKNDTKRQDICDKSTRGLEALQIYSRFKDKDGNVTFMDDKERARRIKNAQANIEQFCK